MKSSHEHITFVLVSYYICSDKFFNFSYDFNIGNAVYLVERIECDAFSILPAGELDVDVSD